MMEYRGQITFKKGNLGGGKEKQMKLPIENMMVSERMENLEIERGTF